MGHQRERSAMMEANHPAPMEENRTLAQMDPPPANRRNHARVVGRSSLMDPSPAVLMDPEAGKADPMTEVLPSAMMDPVCSVRMDPNQSFLQFVLLNLSSLPSILSIKFAIGK